ncbi:MAG: hypothetical protein ACFFD2_00470 [Promethearchaeota archaeon]
MQKEEEGIDLKQMTFNNSSTMTSPTDSVIEATTSYRPPIIKSSSLKPIIKSKIKDSVQDKDRFEAFIDFLEKLYAENNGHGKYYGISKDMIIEKAKSLNFPSEYSEAAIKKLLNSDFLWNDGENLRLNL